jgi:hypothetical protein
MKSNLASAEGFQIEDHHDHQKRTKDEQSHMQ